MKTSKIARKKPGAHSSTAPFPIVAIGASAGGVEALRTLFRSLPPDTGMAYVVIQHLSPFHESLLPEIIGAETQMEVHKVTDGMKPEPNKVYVIPPGTSMGIEGGVLHLSPRVGSASKYMPIDSFFRRFSEDLKERAIAIILSGADSDGAIGLKDVKAHGGITYVQEPTSAKVDGMPRSAVMSGAVDFILTPEQIAKDLARLGKHPYLRKSRIATEGQSFTHEDLAPVFSILRRSKRVDFSQYKFPTINRRIRRRMVLQKMTSLSEYLKLLKESSAEIESLYQDLLIHVTVFFRDPEIYEVLKKKVFPKFLKKRPPETPIRIWIPGCSTGEEAYTIAISLIEFFNEIRIQQPIQIFATDLSETAVEKARLGFYAEGIKSDVSQERLRHFFTRTRGGFQINRAIRDMCVFAVQDVTQDPPFSRMDFISCRNLLIYLGTALQRRVTTMFHYSLNPDGYLMLGSSESVGSAAPLFKLIDKQSKIYSRKVSRAQAGLQFTSLSVPHPPDESDRVILTAPSNTNIAATADRLILTKFAPAGAIIDESGEILQFRGSTGSYLEPAPGNASLNIVKMAREGLMLELRSMIKTVRKTGIPERKDGIWIKQGKEMRQIGAEVAPLSKEGRYLLVLFHESVVMENGSKPKSVRQTPSGNQKVLSQLKQELASTRDYLKTVVQEYESSCEELQSANEEILSSNEELQSTNEELETAKEELQSTNEELTTVNEELYNRNVELTMLNNDLNNLLSSVHLPIIMVGNDLKIRRFTPMAEKIFNLIHSDIGRPIAHLNPNLEPVNLEKLILETIESQSTQESQLHDKSGQSHSLRVQPYRTAEGKVDGAVIILIQLRAN